MLHTLKNVKIGAKQKRWPGGFHYICKFKDGKPHDMDFFLDSEEYDAIKAIDDLKLPEDQAKKVVKITTRHLNFP